MSDQPLSKRMWIATNLGNPDEWTVDNDGVIRDTVRALSVQVVGTVTRKDGIARILWKTSGDVSEVLDWANASDADFLRDLAERLRQVPVMYGTDDGDIDQLLQIARRLS